MSERGSDIEFDFFDDDPETEEAPSRSRPARSGGGGGGGPRRSMRPPAGLTPLLRLAGLIVIAIAVVVVLVQVVQGCRREGKENAYRTYMADVSAIARESQRAGRDFSTLLATRGLRVPELRQELGGLADQQEQGVTRAGELTPPGPLREEHRGMIEALQFRVSGLRRLQDAFQQAVSARGGARGGELLAAQTQRLVASDVIWDDLFKDPAVAELRRQDIGGVQVPDSNFLTSTDLATARSLAQILQRIRGASTGGTPAGDHGHGLISVRALPADQTLSDDEENFVVASEDLAFEVTIENSGDFQEVQVPVRLRITPSERPLERTERVDLINPGERKAVIFRDLGPVVLLAQKTTVRVDVLRVPGEENLANNSRSYSVTFTLTPPS